MIVAKKIESRKSLFASRSVKRGFITIRYKKEFADVVWEAENQSAQPLLIRREILSRCEKFRHATFSFDLDSDGIYFRNVRLADAEALASLLFDGVLKIAGMESAEYAERANVG